MADEIKVQQILACPFSNKQKWICIRNHCMLWNEDEMNCNINVIAKQLDFINKSGVK